jgi:hypothetical protein
MRKGPIIGLGLVLILATLAGLYQMRVQLLTAAFNATLEKSDIRLLRLAGLEIGWDGLEIEELVLGVGENNVRQSLQQVHLEYSLVEIRPQRLTASRMILNLPVTSEPAIDPPAEAGPLLTELVEQLLACPLESISITALEVNGSPLGSQHLQLQASWDDPHFSLLAQARDKQLRLRLQRTGPDQLLLTSQLSSDDQPIIQFTATVSRQGDQQQVQGEGRLVVAAFVPLLAMLMDLPSPAAAATGELVFQLSGLLDDDLSLLTQKQWRLLLMPETELGLTLKTAEEPALDGELRLSFLEPLAITLRLKSAEEFLVTLSGEGVALQLDEQPYSLGARGELSALHCEYAETLHCNSALDILLQAPELSVDGEEATTLTGLELQLSSQLSFDGDQLTATLAPGELMRVESLVQGDIEVSRPVLIADSAGTVNYQLDSGSVRLQVDRMLLLLPRAEMPQLNLATRLSLSGLEIFRDAKKPLQGRIHLSADSINLQAPGAWLPALAFEADVALDRQLLSIKGQVYSDERKPLLTFSADHQLQTQRGSGRILADTITFDADSNRLSRHFAHWPFEWDLYQGSVLSDVGVTWRSVEEGTEIQGKISQRMEGIAGVYQNIGFIGLDGDFEADFSFPDQLITTRPATLSLETLEVGVPIEAIQAHFLVDAARQQLILQTVEAHVFGGRVWTEDAVYHAGSAHNRIDIGVDGLRLGQLLALAGYDAVEGSGRISGLLPADVSATGVVMERGMLAAKAPGGVLRYSAEVTADTNPSLAPVIAALGNYHYNIFQVEADYLESGELVLEMLLRGHNPDYDQGRPIHLNLNITDNIPVLLKSLQSGRVIADTISKKLGGSP